MKQNKTLFLSRISLITILVFLFSIQVSAWGFNFYEIGSEFMVLNFSQVNASNSTGVFVPYSGASNNLNMGNFNITSSGVICDSNGCIGSGGSNGSSYNDSWINNTFLKLDASNDPITGELDINNTLNTFELNVNDPTDHGTYYDSVFYIGNPSFGNFRFRVYNPKTSTASGQFQALGDNMPLTFYGGSSDGSANAGGVSLYGGTSEYPGYSGGLVGQVGGMGEQGGSGGDGRLAGGSAILVDGGEWSGSVNIYSGSLTDEGNGVTGDLGNVSIYGGFNEYSGEYGEVYIQSNKGRAYYNDSEICTSNNGLCNQSFESYDDSWINTTINNTIDLKITEFNSTLDHIDNDTLYYSDEVYINKNSSNSFNFNETKLNETINSEIVSKRNTLFLNGSDFSLNESYNYRDYNFTFDFIISVYAGNMALNPGDINCSNGGLYYDNGAGITICPVLKDATNVEVVYYG